MLGNALTHLPHCIEGTCLLETTGISIPHCWGPAFFTVRPAQHSVWETWKDTERMNERDMWIRYLVPAAASGKSRIPGAGDYTWQIEPGSWHTPTRECPGVFKSCSVLFVFPLSLLYPLPFLHLANSSCHSLWSILLTVSCKFHHQLNKCNAHSCPQFCARFPPITHNCRWIAEPGTMDVSLMIFSLLQSWR